MEYPIIVSEELSKEIFDLGMTLRSKIGNELNTKESLICHWIAEYLTHLAIAIELKNTEKPIPKIYHKDRINSLKSLEKLISESLGINIIETYSQRYISIDKAISKVIVQDFEFLNAYKKMV